MYICIMLVETSPSSFSSLCTSSSSPLHLPLGWYLLSLSPSPSLFDAFTLIRFLSSFVRFSNAICILLLGAPATGYRNSSTLSRQREKRVPCIPLTKIPIPCFMLLYMYGFLSTIYINHRFANHCTHSLSLSTLHYRIIRSKCITNNSIELRIRRNYR